jgi:hypothetical protein
MGKIAIVLILSRERATVDGHCTGHAREAVRENVRDAEQ